MYAGGRLREVGLHLLGVTFHSFIAVLGQALFWYAARTRAMQQKPHQLLSLRAECKEQYISKRNCLMVTKILTIQVREVSDWSFEVT